MNKDNPVLELQNKWTRKKSPHLVIIDRNSKLKKNLKAFKNIDHKRKIIIFTYNKIKNFINQELTIKLKLLI